MRDQTKQKVGSVLDFVNEHIDQNGYPPSVREICAALGHKSTSTVHIYLKELEREGKISKAPSKPRTMRVVRPGDDSGAADKPNAAPAANGRSRTEYRNGAGAGVNAGAGGANGAAGIAGAQFAHMAAAGATATDGNARSPLNAAVRFPAREETVYVPVVGRVTAGKPILAVENIEYTFPVPSFFVNNASVFMLKVEGDSMINAGIFDRDYILVRRQQTAQNGEIVVALIDDEATVKTFYKERNRIRLQPENERYSPIYAINNCTIVGKVIGIFRKL